MSDSALSSGSAPPLLPYEKNYTSQSGEDGVIEHILDVIGENDGWCVEFGAWDGRYLSNTYSLIERRGYSAVQIEADPKKFIELQRTHAARPTVTAINRLVEFEGANRLDAILADMEIPMDFDLLSIDIDGNDYYTCGSRWWNTGLPPVWLTRGLRAFRPHERPRALSQTRSG